MFTNEETELFVEIKDAIDRLRESNEKIAAAILAVGAFIAVANNPEQFSDLERFREKLSGRDIRLTEIFTYMKSKTKEEDNG